MTNATEHGTKLSRILARVLPAGGFGRAVAAVTGGTAVGQLLLIAASPLLSRIYAPADFGILAMYASLAGILGVLGGLAYTQAVPVPDSDDDAANVLAVALTACLGSAALTVAVLALFGRHLLAWDRAVSLGWLLWLAPAGGLGIGVFEALSLWAVRRKAFRLLARTSVTRSGSLVTVQAGWGMWSPSPIGLVAGQLAGHWMGIAALLQLASAHLKKVRLGRMATVAKRYRRFPLVTLPEVAINAVSNFAPALLLAYFFGASVLGFYALQDRVTLVPIWLVGASVQRVFFASATDALREGRLAALTDQVFRQLASVALPFVAILAAVAPSAFALFFGDTWRESGVYAQWLCIRTAMTVVVFPLTPLIYVREKQLAGVAFQLLLLVCRLGPIFVGGMFGSARLAIGLTGAFIGVAWLVYLPYLMQLSGNRWTVLLRPIGAASLASTILVSPVLIARFFGATDLLVTALAAVAGLVAALVAAKRGLATSR